MKTKWTLVVALLIVACASGAKDDSPVTVRISDVNVIGDLRFAGPISTRFRVEVTNPTSEPVTLKHISLSTPDGPFQLEQRTRAYNDVIAPGGSKQVDYWARAQVRDANLGAATPSLVRAIIQFEGSQGKRSESFMRDVNGRFAAGIG